MKMLSIGCNSKLGKKIGVFNLPAIKTCPGSTTYCRQYCYARKAERQYPAARAMRERNYVFSQSPDFVSDMTLELTKFKGDKIRIHESGCFYSQEYLDKWITIASAFHASLTFLAYTKMYDKLDFSKKPDNLVVYASYDPTTETEITCAPSGMHKCLIVDNPASPAEAILMNDGWYSCEPVSKTHRNYCGVSCNVCWVGSNNVVFQKH